VASLAWLGLGLGGGRAAAQPGPDSSPQPTVIVLSWDGTRWDYPDRATLPGLERMARDGVRAGRLIPVFPTSTFPNHVALATGAHTDVHGIVANVFDDPELGLYRYSKEARFIAAEPIWIAAERQGVRSAVFFWVGSETDWRGARASYRKTPFDSGVGEAEKVDQILGWLDLPADARPRLIMAWWHGADSTGHSHGPDHEDITSDLIEQDAQLQRLFEGLDRRDAWGHTTLLIVSDHGMTVTGEPLEVLPPLRARGIAAKIRRGGGFGYVALEDPGRTAEALEVLGRIAGLRAYRSDALPPELRGYSPRRTGHITVIPEPPNVIWSPRNFTAQAWVAGSSLLGGKFGLHGYPPDHADMHAVFFALGRGVPSDLALESVRSIDVAPTVAHLLGIDPPRDAEGVPIPGVGATKEGAP
jgi:predicted AlkP superfamily pyrophosphatase or phosphodiesterase